jgi:hypothetical protein
MVLDEERGNTKMHGIQSLLLTLEFGVCVPRQGLLGARKEEALAFHSYGKQATSECASCLESHCLVEI